MTAKRVLFLLLLLSCCLLPAQAETQETGKRRALLIGCDHFVTQPDTYPAAEHNLEMLSDVIAADKRGYVLIRSCTDTVKSREDFETLLKESFGGACERDVSFLYIGTHGIYAPEQSNLEAALLLSDGHEEYALTAKALSEMLSAIPGQKILVLDACKSGAFLGKGIADTAFVNPFQGPDFKVICSAGGNEASWYWQGAHNGGASYFATVLADALGLNGDHAADENADGAMTLREVYRYLCDNYAASMPQVYPEYDNETVLYTYDTAIETPPHKALTDLTFDETLLPSGDSEIRFSFTMQRPVPLFYQLVYYQEGEWRFSSAQQFQDAEQENTPAGRQTRMLHIDTGSMENHGYAMVQFITMEKGKPVQQGARLLCVQPRFGEIQLSVSATPVFQPSIGQEACILALHDVPCGLTVSLLNAEGETVRRLCYEMPSRPQQLSPNGSALYWDGKDNRGNACPPGLYTALFQAKCGRKTFTAQSEPIEIRK